jgi:hypothetical protein
MKVVYTDCYGGFGLSRIASKMYHDAKGTPLYWYFVSGDYPNHNFTKVADITTVPVGDYNIVACLSDFGDTPVEVAPIYSLDCHHDNHGIRTDPDLIRIVEELGEEASGKNANLVIVYVPVGYTFKIEEFDGKEIVLFIERPTTDYRDKL